MENVFETMLSMEISFVARTDAIERFSTDEEPFIIAAVGFVGNANGLVYLCMPEDFGQFVTGHMLGMSPAEVVEAGHSVMNDAVGEVANMAVGGFKNAICDIGYPCKLTLPTIIRGRTMSLLASKAATRHVLHFSCKGKPIVIDLQLKHD